MNFLKRFHVFEIALVAVILSVHLYAALSDAYNLPNTWFTRDDAYYYFKTAENITEGHGSSLDGVNPTNGYHPLWMAICIPIFFLARYDLILPLRVLLMVMAVLNAATAVLIYRLVKSNLSHAVALLAAPFWAFNFYIHYVVYEFGLETPLAAFAVILFIYKLSQFERTWRKEKVTARQLAILGGIAVIVLFSRLDLVFLAVIGGLWVVFRGKPLRNLLPLDVIAVFASMVTSVVYRTGFFQYNTIYAASAVRIALLALAVKLPSLYFFGVYQHPRANSLWVTLRQTVLALLTSSVLIAGLHFILAQFGITEDFPRSALLLDLALSTVLVFGIRLIAYWFSDRAMGPGVQASPIKELQANWMKWLTDGLAYFGVLGGALALYMLFNKLMFGTGTPVSGQVKRWWGTLGYTVYDNPAPDWFSFFGLSFHWVYDAWQPTSNFFTFVAKRLRPLYPGANTLDERYYIAMLGGVIVVFIIFLFNAHRVRNKLTNMAILPLIAGCGIHILSYTTTAYGGAKEWYWVSEMVLLVLVESVLFDILFKPFQRTRLTRPAMQIAAVVISLMLAFKFGNYVVSVMRYDYFPVDRPFMEVLPYIEKNTPPGAMIGMTGGGNVAYFIHDRTIVNMDGLINSYAYFKSLQNGEAPMYLQHRGMTIVFANPQLLTVPPYNGQFAPYLERYSSYGGKDLMYLLEKPKY